MPAYTCDYCGDEAEHPEIQPLSREERAKGQTLACAACDRSLRDVDEYDPQDDTGVEDPTDDPAFLEERAAHHNYMAQFNGEV